jgi:hypothetical protein
MKMNDSQPPENAQTAEFRFNGHARGGFPRASDVNLTLRRHITILQQIHDAVGRRQSLTKNS